MIAKTILRARQEKVNSEVVFLEKKDAILIMIEKACEKRRAEIKAGVVL